MNIFARYWIQKGLSIEARQGEKGYVFERWFVIEIPGDEERKFPGAIYFLLKFVFMDQSAFFIQ